MSLDTRAGLLVIHLVSALFMAAPLYMLIVVNERGRFAVPPGHNTDRFLENIIKNQPKRCYAYLAAILVSGLLVLNPWTAGYGDRLIQWPILGKLGALILLAGLLSYVHLGVQPRIEALLAQVQGSEIPARGSLPG